MKRHFAIGDLHGCSRTFRKMVLEEINLGKQDELFLLGDYVDRGPDSKGVIDFILKLKSEGYQVHAIRGNHDQMMMDSHLNDEDFIHWVQNGGMETLKSFGVNSYDELDSVYKTFFYQTQFYFEVDNYILVHAGLNFKNEDPLEDTHAMMWIRNFKVDEKKLGNRTIIHGHTPVSWNAIKMQATTNVINIDGGCVYDGKPDFGLLVAFELETRRFITLKNCE